MQLNKFNSFPWIEQLWNSFCQSNENYIEFEWMCECDWVCGLNWQFQWKLLWMIYVSILPIYMYICTFEYIVANTIHICTRTYMYFPISADISVSVTHLFCIFIRHFFWLPNRCVPLNLNACNKIYIFGFATGCGSYTTYISLTLITNSGKNFKKRKNNRDKIIKKCRKYEE